MAKKTETGSSEASRALAAIQAGLPCGYKTTNKKAVKKKIRSIGSSSEEIFWSSWVLNGSSRGLAYIKANGEVKLIKEKDFGEYEFNGKTNTVA